MRTAAPATGWLLATALLAGCATGPPNPTLPVTPGDARALLREMRRDPLPLERPVVILGGLNDPGFEGTSLAGTLGTLTGTRGQVLPLTFMKLDTGTFDGCRDYVIRSVERTFGPGPQGETVEVDVVGYSMGGLVARHAARPRDDGGKRLKIHRLFTISTPHRGARLATLPTLDARTLDMRLGSPFLHELDLALASADYPIFAYTRTNDWVVGEENTAPPGQDPWWVPVGALAPSHIGAPTDPRIVADIARRLRGEPALATLPAAPLPQEPPPRKAQPQRFVATFGPPVRTDEGDPSAPAAPALGFSRPAPTPVGDSP